MGISLVDVLRVNQTIFSWESCIFKIDNNPTTGLVALDYEQKRERKVVFGGRRDGRPLGITAGKYTVPSFSMKMLKDSADAFTTYLSLIGLGSYGDPFFGVQVQCDEDGVPPLTMSATPCWIVGKKDSHEEGIDELVVEFEVACIGLTENGKSLYSIVRSLGQ